MGIEKEKDAKLEAITAGIMLRNNALEKCPASDLYHDTGQYTADTLDELKIVEPLDNVSESDVRKKMKQMLDESPLKKNCKYCNP